MLHHPDVLYIIITSVSIHKPYPDAETRKPLTGDSQCMHLKQHTYNTHIIRTLPAHDLHPLQLPHNMLIPLVSKIVRKIKFTQNILRKWQNLFKECTGSNLS